MDAVTYGNRFFRSFYYAAPSPLKTLITTAYGFAQRRQRYGDSFCRHLAFLSESQGWDNESLLRFQQVRLQDFLRLAAAETPFYSSREEYRAGAKTGDLSRFPLLTKQAVREHQDELIRTGFDRQPHRMVHTSGTTGKSLTFPVTAECFQREYAFREVHYSWSKASLVGLDPFAFIAGHPVAHPDRTRPPFWTFDMTSNHLFFSSYHLSEKTMPAYVRELESFNPIILAGYPSSVYLLALAFRKHGREKLRLKGVYTFSETLMDFQRAAIQEAFGCHVFNWYGNTEMCANIVECEKGELHLKIEHSVVEVLNDRNEACQPGETGRLVCTGFGNPAFPFIRYEVGDVVTLSKEKHARCGRGGILVDEVLGRMEDYVITPDGRIVGRLDHIFKDGRRVVEAQIVQNAIEEIVVRIVREPSYTPEDEKAILREARLRLGDSVRIGFQYVDSIPRGDTGKFRFIVSKIDQKKILKELAG